MKNGMLIAGILLFFVAGPSFAANYVEPDELKQWLENGKQMVIVDIQTAPEFARHHFKGAIETNAYPGKTAEEKKLLDRALPAINASAETPVVIVCPKGGGGAKNAYEYLQSKGIAEERLQILSDGIKGWPYKEMLMDKIKN